jgi:hypothetical protein
VWDDGTAGIQHEGVSARRERGITQLFADHADYSAPSRVAESICICWAGMQKCRTCIFLHFLHFHVRHCIVAGISIAEMQSRCAPRSAYLGLGMQKRMQKRIFESASFLHPHDLQDPVPSDLQAGRTLEEARLHYLRVSDLHRYRGAR